jgi:hypothetical protein
MKALFFCWFSLLIGLVAAEDAYERPPIRYSEAAPNDPAAKLGEAIKAGQRAFTGDDRQTVKDLLAAFGALPSSQVLVFSKTSFQNDRINPRHPRAIYFSDNVYIGWAPGGLAEIAAIDPTLGPVFYSFDPHPGARDKFVRDPDCLRCHGGTFVRDIPSVLARSVFTDPDGQPRLALGSEVIDAGTPFDHRWGGWYVAGRTGSVAHRGNVLLSEDREPTKEELAKTSNVTDLGALFDAKPYLSPTSDIVALLVIEHQIGIHNTLTRANQQCLRMMAYQEGVQRDLKEPISSEPTWESVRTAFSGATEQILDALLFRDEAPIPPGGVAGVNSFADDFQMIKGRDGRVSPLRVLDLKTRIFKTRCSYIIETEAFHKLQPVLRRKVLERLWRIVDQPDSEPRYGHLEASERATIKAFVRATIPDLPACWNPGG